MPGFGAVADEEIPPRARRRVDGVLAVGVDYGNTSACAEKSSVRAGPAVPAGKYLRVRGEEPIQAHGVADVLEIPPRARRRGVTRAINGGTNGKYLRVRGEETTSTTNRLRGKEIPPRARRRVT